MTKLIPGNFETVVPSEADVQLAREPSRRLATWLTTCQLDRQSSVRIKVMGNDEEAELVVVPTSAFRLFLQLLTEMSHGNAVTLIPTHAELSTQQAADLLNVSRPYLIGLLEKGEIPHRKVGTHRRVLFQDLMAYKQKIDAARLKALEELSALDQELGGMGYCQ